MTTKEPIRTDALIVGAGPCGLFQVFELGLLGIHARVVDSLKHVGGQCTELYPDKPIYDIPGIPVCSGQELIDNLMEQIRPFAPDFHLGEEALTLTPKGDGDGDGEGHGEGDEKDDGKGGGFEVVTDLGTRFDTRTVFIAGGVGSFQPRRPKLEGIDAYEERSVFYRVRDPERFAGRSVAVLGGGDSALDWTLALQPIVGSLTLVHRRPEYRAAPASVAAMKRLVADGKMREIIGRVTGYDANEQGLSGIEITTEDGAEQVGCDAVLVFWGQVPKLGPIADWGLDLNRRTINVDTEKFETSIPGVYAIGDVNHYPGKKKLILSGFHEAALAAFAAKERLEPGKKARLQYTTTSPLMHERLGVKPD